MVDKLDNADVIMISNRGNYGYIKIQGTCENGIEVCYLAICKYPQSDTIYLFLCNENMDVENDWDCDSIDEAIENAQRRSKNPIVWNIPTP